MDHTPAKKTWVIWIGFFLFYSAFLTQSAKQAFNPYGEMFRYYRVLCAYDISFWFPFICNLLTVLLGILAIIPMMLYMLNIESRRLWIWKAFFTLRLATEIFGHSYELKFIQAISHQDLYVSILASIHMLVWVLPSHLIVFLYAFPKGQKPRAGELWNKIFRKSRLTN